MAISLTSGWRQERLVTHLRAESAPWSEAPFWRLPSAGGGTVLRHGPIGRFRDRHLAAAVAEWRMALDRTVGAVVFVEGALIDGLHAGAGVGLRLRLPPRPTNSLRLDVGVGDGGVGVSVGWGEMF